MDKKLVIIGASGHGKVVADIALKNGYKIVGFLDDDDSIKEICGFPVLGKISKIHEYERVCEFIIAIGNNVIRERISEQYDVNWATLIHPTAVIGMQCEIGSGTVVMANAIVNPCATIGKHCIINTGALVEHDNVLDDYVHISPNASVAGTVHIGKRTHIGVGACVKNNLCISADAMIGAGAAVVKDIPTSGVYVGIPARRMK